MSVGEIRTWLILLGLVFLIVAVPAVLVAALSIWLWRRRERPYLAWGVVVGGVATWLVCALVGFAVMVNGMGDQPLSRIWLENEASSDIFLVTPERDPVPGSVLNYTRFKAGDHYQLHASSNSSRCLPPVPGNLVGLPAGFSLEHFEDLNGQSRSVDPDPAITSILAELPAGKCFDSERVWLVWTGTELVESKAPSDFAGPAKFIGLILIVTLGGGFGIDLFRGRGRSSQITGNV